MNAHERRKARRAWLRHEINEFLAGPTSWDAGADEDEDADLPDGLWRDSTGTLTYTCRHCDSEREWCGEPHEFDMFNHIECGGSPYCMP